ncbi:MAG: pentapeptide repeat-containing protein [Desulforhopalus sp.]
MEIVTRKCMNIIIFIICLQVFTLVKVEPAVAAANAAALDNLEQLIQTGSCKGCDLAGLNFTRMNLSGMDLEGADLSRAKLNLTNLSGANLRNTKLIGAVFGGTDLDEADLRGADLTGASLDNAYLGQALIDSKAPVADTGSDKEQQVGLDDTPPPDQPLENSEIRTINKENQTSMDIVAEVVPAKKQPDEKKFPDKDIHAGSPKIVAVAAEETETTHLAVASDISVNEEQKKVISDTMTEDSVGDSQSTFESAAAGTLPSLNNRKEMKTIEGGTPAKPSVEMAEAQENSLLRGEHSPTDAGKPDEELNIEKRKQANLTRLLDENRCYECDLAGLDLSGRDLEEADLEKADLSDCNLENADLDQANLKGSLLQRANLRNASLKWADLYKADLTDADLTGADVKGAQFDGAKVSEAIGLNGASVLLDNSD